MKFTDWIMQANISVKEKQRLIREEIKKEWEELKDCFRKKKKTDD